MVQMSLTILQCKLILLEMDKIASDAKVSALVRESAGTIVAKCRKALKEFGR